MGQVCTYSINLRVLDPFQARSELHGKFLTIRQFTHEIIVQLNIRIVISKI